MPRPHVLDLRVINRAKLAEYSGVKVNAIQRLFTGKTQPDFVTARRLAKALGITLDQFAAAFDRMDEHPKFPGLLDENCCRNGH